MCRFNWMFVALLVAFVMVVVAEERDKRAPILGLLLGKVLGGGGHHHDHHHHDHHHGHGGYGGYGGHGYGHGGYGHGGHHY